jgi:hypothetical protein
MNIGKSTSVQASIPSKLQWRETFIILIYSVYDDLVDARFYSFYKREESPRIHTKYPYLLSIYMTLYVRKHTVIRLGQINTLSAKILIGTNGTFQVTAMMIVCKEYIKVITHSRARTHTHTHTHKFALRWWLNFHQVYSAYCPSLLANTPVA